MSSSNINEVIRSVLNFLLFHDKISQVRKALKALKSIKHKKAKAQNSNKRIKIKNALKNIEVEKSNLFVYLRRKVSTIEMLVPLNQ